MRIKTCSFIALFTVLILGVNAQGNQLSYQVNTGISIPILDNGTGIQIGFNPTWMLSDYVGLEGQVSYNYMVLSGTFISGKTGHAQALNALAGGRVYLIPPDKIVRLFFNLLIGGNYLKEITDTKNTSFGLGLSAGTYLSYKKYLLGFGAETNGYWVMKLGYTF